MIVDQIVKPKNKSVMKKAGRESETQEVNAVPEGYHTITPFLVVNGASRLMNFISRVFDGEIVSEMKGENDTIRHATMRIGDSLVMIADTMENFPPVPAMLYLYMDDVDAVYRRAIGATAESLREPTDEFYGDRSAGVRDEWGNQWWIATHREDVSQEELERRMQKAGSV